jgi:hypothetical protein
MVFNATFNNISVKSWWSVLLVEETGENHRQTVSHNVLSSTSRHQHGDNSETFVLHKRQNLDMEIWHFPWVLYNKHRKWVAANGAMFPSLRDSRMTSLQNVRSIRKTWPSQTPTISSISFFILFWIDRVIEI